jgi:hypothetical protein
MFARSINILISFAGFENNLGWVLWVPVAFALTPS